MTTPADEEDGGPEATVVGWGALSIAAGVVAVLIVPVPAPGLSEVLARSTGFPVPIVLLGAGLAALVAHLLVRPLPPRGVVGLARRATLIAGVVALAVATVSLAPLA